MTNPSTDLPRAKTGHARRLGLWTCIALVAGNMIGSGIFLLPASLAPYGALSFAGWVASALGAIVLALVFARLAAKVPKAGGPYAFARAGFGDFAAFLVAWGYWISILVTNAAIAVAFVGYLAFFWPVLGESPVAGAACAVATLWGVSVVNSVGVHAGGLVQVVTTVLKIVPLVLIGTVGLFFMEPAHFALPDAPPAGAGSWLEAFRATVTLTMWAFLGLESATIPADDVHAPERTIPRATVIATLLAAGLYLLSSTAVLGILPPEELAVSTAPFAEAGRLALGAWVGPLVAAGATISCLGALNGWVLLQGQVPRAAARDGVFPAFFARESANGTPVLAIVLSSGIATVLLLANFTKGLVALFTYSILLATLTALVPYVFATMTELYLVLKDRDGPVPWGRASLAAAAFVFALLAIAGSGFETVYWGFLLLLCGVPFYVGIRLRNGASPSCSETPSHAGPVRTSAED